MNPPCQDFSSAGKRDKRNPRAFLYERALEGDRKPEQMLNFIANPNKV